MGIMELKEDNSIKSAVRSVNLYMYSILNLVGGSNCVVECSTETGKSIGGNIPRILRYSCRYSTTHLSPPPLNPQPSKYLYYIPLRAVKCFHAVP
jgi:hypothetical protein